MTSNLKLVLRTYAALRQMSPDDIALLETLRALNDSDRELLLDAMTDKPAGKKAGKKSSKSSSSKSPRATGIEQQLSKRREQGRGGTTVVNGDDDNYCTHQYEHDGIMVECGEPADQNIHHLSSVEGYHPFVSESHVPTAPTRSPANGGAGSGTANSEIVKDAASTVAHGAGGGD